MKKMIIGVVLATMVLFGQNAFSQETAKLERIGTSIQDPNEPVASIWKQGGNWDASKHATCPLCDVLTFDPTTEIGKTLYSTALAAFIAGKGVRVWTNGCYKNRPKVVRIDIAHYW
ncbi:MAG: hypothetical protein AMJ94_11690 [Deltaproteobacteria bacterium SM23_61]|nr:MAG: hypothetical protein AMJ94_11690 [Deltaproteobacteria bacterium SM23_61]